MRNEREKKIGADKRKKKKYINKRSVGFQNKHDLKY